MFNAYRTALLLKKVPAKEIAEMAKRPYFDYMSVIYALVAFVVGGIFYEFMKIVISDAVKKPENKILFRLGKIFDYLMRGEPELFPTTPPIPKSSKELSTDPITTKEGKDGKKKLPNKGDKKQMKIQRPISDPVCTSPRKAGVINAGAGFSFMSNYDILELQKQNAFTSDGEEPFRSSSAFNRVFTPKVLTPPSTTRLTHPSPQPIYSQNIDQPSVISSIMPSNSTGVYETKDSEIAGNVSTTNKHSSRRKRTTTPERTKKTTDKDRAKWLEWLKPADLGSTDTAHTGRTRSAGQIITDSPELRHGGSDERIIKPSTPLWVVTPGRKRTTSPALLKHKTSEGNIWYPSSPESDLNTEINRVRNARGRPSSGDASSASSCAGYSPTGCQVGASQSPSWKQVGASQSPSWKHRLGTSHSPAFLQSGTGSFHTK